MILYNITIILDEEIHESWIKWLKNDYLKNMMIHDHFISQRVLKVLDSPNEGHTYCIQFVAESVEKYNSYKRLNTDQLQNYAPAEFLNKFVVFSTLMEFIETE
jgi:hypothetical protein